MATKLFNATVKVKRGSSTKWTSVNPILLQGEFGFETDTGKIKIGNGTTLWNLLSYIGTSSNSVYEIADASDIVQPLPDASIVTTDITVKRRGAGSGKVLFTTESGQTIEGLTASVWLLAGIGELVLFSNAGNWEVKKHSDKVIKDWSSTSVFTAGNTFDITHNLNVTFDSLNTQLFTRNPSSPDKIYEGKVSSYGSSGTSTIGNTIQGKDGDLDNVVMQVHSVGGAYINDSGQFITLPTNWEYKVVLRIKD